MSKPGSAPTYCAYVLRCWHESTDDAGARGWRFGLEDVHTSARYGFASFAALMSFLHDQFIDDPVNGELGATVDEIG